MTRLLLIGLGLVLLQVKAGLAPAQESAEAIRIAALVAQLDEVTQSLEASPSGGVDAEDDSTEESVDVSVDATTVRQWYQAASELRQALDDGDPTAFQEKLTLIKSLGSWEPALSTLADAVDGESQQMRAAAKTALVEVAQDQDNRVVVNRAVEILARAGDSPLRFEITFREVLPSLYFFVAGMLVAGVFCAIALFVDQRLKGQLGQSQLEGSAGSVILRMMRTGAVSLAVLASLIGLSGVPSIVFFAIQTVPETLHLWLLLTTFGAFGGLLVSIFYDRVYLPRPHQDKLTTYDLGLVGDCLFGVAGASIVFLVVPGEFSLDSSWSVIKVVSTAIIGGFAGRALVERVASQTLKDMNALKQKQAESEEEEKTDAVAEQMLDQQLDQEKEAFEADRLRQTIANASLSFRTRAFSEARRFRMEMLKEGSQDSITAMVKTKPIFEGLVLADKEQIYHRNYAQLAYLAKDQLHPGLDDWKEAFSQLNKAIASRDKQREHDSFKMYEYCRALCRIALDENFRKNEPSESATRQMILDDLIAGLAEPTMGVTWLQQQFQKKSEGKLTRVLTGQIDLVERWLNLNNARERVGLAVQPETPSAAPAE